MDNKELAKRIRKLAKQAHSSNANDNKLMAGYIIGLEQAAWILEHQEVLEDSSQN